MENELVRSRRELSNVNDNVFDHGWNIAAGFSKNFGGLQENLILICKIRHPKERGKQEQDCETTLMFFWTGKRIFRCNPYEIALAPWSMPYSARKRCKKKTFWACPRVQILFSLKTAYHEIRILHSTQWKSTHVQATSLVFVSENDVKFVISDQFDTLCPIQTCMCRERSTNSDSILVAWEWASGLRLQQLCVALECLQQEFVFYHHRLFLGSEFLKHLIGFFELFCSLGPYSKEGYCSEVGKRQNVGSRTQPVGSLCYIDSIHAVCGSVSASWTRRVLCAAILWKKSIKDLKDSFLWGNQLLSKNYHKASHSRIQDTKPLQQI